MIHCHITQRQPKGHGTSNYTFQVQRGFSYNQ